MIFVRLSIYLSSTALKSFSLLFLRLNFGKGGWLRGRTHPITIFSEIYQNISFWSNFQDVQPNFKILNAKFPQCAVKKFFEKMEEFHVFTEVNKKRHDHRNTFFFSRPSQNLLQTFENVGKCSSQKYVIFAKENKRN